MPWPSEPAKLVRWYLNPGLRNKTRKFHNHATKCRANRNAVDRQKVQSTSPNKANQFLNSHQHHMFHAMV